MFQKHVYHLNIIFIALGSFLCVFSSSSNVLGMSMRNGTGMSYTPQVESRNSGGEARFQNANWKVWDHPVDQIAIESSGTNPRKSKYIYKNSTSQVYPYGLPENKFTNNGESNGMKRQDCNANLQVSILPIILAIIAVVAGIIGIFILWVIAKKWVTLSGGTGGSWGSNNNGTPQQSGGWSNQQRQDLLGFSKSLKNFDFDQLTNFASKALETYDKVFGSKSGAK